MITRTFENPFHVVVLNYDDSKKETDYEKNLVERYISFLNKMHEKRELIKTLTDKLHYQLLVADRTMEEFQKSKAQFDSIIPTVEEFKKERILDIPAYLEIREKFDRAADDYMEFDKVYVDEYRHVIDDNEKLFNELYAWFEDEESEKCYSDFDDYSEELYKNYDNYSLDLCRYDQDVESMKDEWQKVSDEWDALFELRERVAKTGRECAEQLDSFNKVALGLRDEIRIMNDSWSALNN